MNTNRCIEYIRLESEELTDDGGAAEAFVATVLNCVRNSSGPIQSLKPA